MGASEVEMGEFGGGSSFSFGTVPVAKENDNRDRIKWSDCGNIALLLLMYTLQGIPMGIHTAIPLIIYKRATYSQIALLACTSIPFSLKLLWAPILDVVYIKRIGKRKTWLIPTQVLCGLFLLYMGYNDKLDHWLGEDGSPVQLLPLFSFFLILYILGATQDIAVDGWALTMLRPDIRVHASTCNVAGQAFGINLSFVGIITLNDRHTCNILRRIWSGVCGSLGLYHHQDIGAAVEQSTSVERVQPLLTFSGFVRILGILILLCTIMASLKTEIEEMPAFFDLVDASVDPRASRRERAWASVAKSYRMLRRVLSLKPVLLLCFIVLTKGVFFAPENVTHLKLLSKGMPRDIFFLVTPLSIPLEIMGPAFISMHMNRRSLSRVLFGAMLLRMFAMLLYIGYVHLAGVYFGAENLIPGGLFYGLFFFVALFHKLCCLVTFVTDVALFAKVSDPGMGGTYMSLFNTVSNFGHLWPHSLGLSLVDRLDRGPVDGLYLEAGVCVCLAVLLVPLFRRAFAKLEGYECSEWYVSVGAGESGGGPAG